MKKIFITCILLGGLFAMSHAQTTSPGITNGGKAGTVTSHAEKIMADAYVQAVKENKSVFVMFHASWCTWCHKMDASMNDAACKDFFDKHFVVVHMVVDESKDKKNLETPGADAMRTQYHGEGQGIPFWLIFDSKGVLISDSKLHKPSDNNDIGENVGCPASDAEVNFFIGALKKAVSVSAVQEAAIRERFRKNDVN